MTVVSVAAWTAQEPSTPPSTRRFATKASIDRRSRRLRHVRQHDRSAADRVAGAQARGRVRARHGDEVRPDERAARAVGVRPRLGARQADDRDGRAALHAAARLRRGVESVDERANSSCRAVLSRGQVRGRHRGDAGATEGRRGAACSRSSTHFIDTDRVHPVAAGRTAPRQRARRAVRRARRRQGGARHRRDCGRRRGRPAEAELRDAGHRVRAAAVAARAATIRCRRSCSPASTTIS